MTRKELIYVLFDEHNDKRIKLLRDCPTLLRDLYAVEEYEQLCHQNKSLRIHAYKQRSRDAILERYCIGVNHFYAIRIYIRWLLAKM